MAHVHAHTHSELPNLTEPHTHRHDHSARNRSKIGIVLLLTIVYMLAEAAGGWWTGSLALMADAGHMLADAAALGLALVAMWFGSRPATPQKTFGYYRTEILAALVNGVALVGISICIIYEALQRWSAPPVIRSNVMIAVAAGGLIVNLFSAWLLHGDHETDLNVRGAWLHVLGDALGSVGAIVAGILMSVYGWYTADPVFSIAISVLIVWSSWNLIRESTNVLLEGTPSHINLAAVEQAFLQTEGVEEVHDLHIWTITSGREALSAHVRHHEWVSQPELLRVLRKKLFDAFGVDHLTIQMETRDFEDESFHFCYAGTACFRSARNDTADLQDPIIIMTGTPDRAQRLTTTRLELYPGNIQLARAETTDRRLLGNLLDADVPVDWPPPLNDEESMSFFMRRMEESPEQAGWWMWYFILRGDNGNRNVVIGNGGFKGPPDSTGTVEVGYSIIPDYQCKGFCTEAVRELIAWAFRHPQVTRVIAETLPELAPSIRVMEKNGMTFVGQGSEEGVISYEITRRSFEQRHVTN
jgi:cobalt-zinc-cadmium efflux system protein